MRVNMAALLFFQARQRRLLWRNRIFRDRTNPFDMFDDREVFVSSDFVGSTSWNWYVRYQLTSLSRIADSPSLLCSKCSSLCASWPRQHFKTSVENWSAWTSRQWVGLSAEWLSLCSDKPGNISSFLIKPVLTEPNERSTSLTDSPTRRGVSMEHQCASSGHTSRNMNSSTENDTIQSTFR